MQNKSPANAYTLSACEARALIDEGLLTSQQLVEACLDRIEALEESIGAWAHLDRELALESWFAGGRCQNGAQRGLNTNKTKRA